MVLSGVADIVDAIVGEPVGRLSSSSAKAGVRFCCETMLVGELVGFLSSGFAKAGAIVGDLLRFFCEAMLVGETVAFDVPVPPKIFVTMDDNVSVGLLVGGTSRLVDWTEGKLVDEPNLQVSSRAGTTPLYYHFDDIGWRMKMTCEMRSVLHIYR